MSDFAVPGAPNVFVAWIVAVVFASSWYRKRGGWTSNAFAAIVVLCVDLPVFLAVYLGSNINPDEHLKRLMRTRVFVLAMTIRGLMLTQLVGVLTIVGLYAMELRGYDRTTAGWLMVPATLAMASTTVLTTCFHRRRLRHVWLIGGILGSAASVWWLSSLDNFTSNEHIALILTFWGAFLGLFSPAFLSDEIEGVPRKDMLYAGCLTMVGIVTPIITVPTTIARAFSRFICLRCAIEATTCRCWFSTISGVSTGNWGARCARWRRRRWNVCDSTRGPETSVSCKASSSKPCCAPAAEFCCRPSFPNLSEASKKQPRIQCPKRTPGRRRSSSASGSHPMSAMPMRKRTVNWTGFCSRALWNSRAAISNRPLSFSESLDGPCA